MAQLRKPKQYDWKDSNLALFGSDLDKDTKKSAAETEPAWRIAGRKPGLQIWRIVNFKVTTWPEEDYGKFYDGDSYIVLNTYKDQGSDILKYDVHFWIGKYSTQDEYGTAAYKTVELDTYLDDRPIQHREVQGHESKLFKSYFKTIELLRGGADSGFRHVEAEAYQSRLLHFHGDKRHVEIAEISRSKDLLDSSDVYILDLGKKIYQWNGKQSNKDERYMAAVHVNKIKQDRGKCTSETLDEGMSACGVFYGKLDENVDDIVDSEEENQNITKSDTIKKLFRLSDAEGEMKFNLEKENNMAKNDLDSNDVFILDTCQDVFVWIGNGSSKDERRNAMVYAHNYLTTTCHPLLPITCIMEENTCRQFEVALTA
ncbi:gelsolin-like protein 2 [Mya arenaria]|uniref:gelsolin-like protein 2 n=1 Tax=Mya arenaria TaxID=6604 RepID=UPI0022E26EF9|nr:gelsolin-like protein 2 [Mya arenaria]